MAKQKPYITGCRVERPATLAADAQRRSDQALLDRYRAAIRIIDGVEAPAEQRGEIIRDFVTGRGDQFRPMATRNPPPPRYSLTVIAINVALIVASIIGAAWLVIN